MAEPASNLTDRLREYAGWTDYDQLQMLLREAASALEQADSDLAAQSRLAVMFDERSRKAEAALEQAEKALQAISDIGIEMGGEPYDWEQDIYDIAREALAVLGGQDKQA